MFSDGVMLMKKLKKPAAVLICILIFLQTSAIFSFGALSNSASPTSPDEARLEWSVKLGKSYKDAPSVPAISGKYIYVMSSNQLLKLNKNTGETVSSVKMAEEPCFGYTPVTVSADMIFCPLDNGTVQAFGTDMKSRWIYKNELSGQSLTQIVCSDGRVYAAFWNDEELDAEFVCLDASDGKEIWSYTKKGGFYWTKCFVNDKYVVVGSDNGSGQTNANSKLLCFDKTNGRLIDSKNICGDQRSGITEYEGMLYFVTKAGYLYKAQLSENGKLTILEALKLSGASTSTPAIYNGRIYIGVQSSGFSGKLNVIDAEKMSLIYSAEMKGYPQNEMLVCNAYYKSSGKVYIYSTYNAPPGGISVITDTADRTQAVSQELYTPDAGYQGYCISPVIADSDGTLYFKNDSGTLFAVSKATDIGNASFFELIIRLFKAVINLFVQLLSL